MREDIAEELKFQPKDRKLAFALLSAFRTAALRHMGESWEPIIMEAGRQFLKIVEIAEGKEIESIEDALNVAAEYGLISGFEMDEDSVTLEGVLESLGWDERTRRGEAACVMTKGIVLEGLRREGLDVVELEEDPDGYSVTFRWKTR
ncbi:hypothetical protein [Methanopyrus sp. SNP6]|uniref:hypothetical protein n=1 Tax=Methanopyrus sp. SNP6 TaxID=1937005 RepID=UPI0011E5FAC6|nr:hypothetical protein [Methanopyrus sp. SNP6]